jgi:hypothetical protein
LPKSLKQMQAEGRAYSEAHGWYDIPRTWGEEIALLHSEASEALDAFRQWGLEDMTKRQCGSGVHLSMNGDPIEDPNHLCKPEGVGSELADVLIRLLDSCERHNFDIEHGGFEIGWTTRIYNPDTCFGNMITDLHGQIQMWYKMKTNRHAALIYTELKAICQAVNIDLGEEYQRKYDFNQTRPYRHGNKRL